MIEKRIDHVVEFLREKVKESGTKGLIVGLSGGIDSSVVAFLIKKAFPDNSLGVIMPIKHRPEDVEYAVKLADASGIDYKKVDLKDVHSLLKEKVYDEVSEEDRNDRLADANMQARLRMTTLYSFANLYNYMVVGTDNAAELLTGYFTKYGDGGVDLLPIARLTKREVFEWGRYFGVPSEILDRAPSAGLWDGQTDEEEMGVTYDNIDDYLMGLYIPEDKKKIIDRMNRVSEHKRELPPMPVEFPEE